jgi:hypothetical protein
MPDNNQLFLKGFQLRMFAKMQKLQTYLQKCKKQDGKK